MSIKNAVVINLKNILDKYPNIKVVAINGGKAKALFDKYLLSDAKGRVEIIYLPSNSPANARMTQKNLTEAYSILLK